MERFFSNRRSKFDLAILKISAPVWRLSILSREDLGGFRILSREDTEPGLAREPQVAKLQGSSTATFEGGAKYPASVIQMRPWWSISIL